MRMYSGWARGGTRDQGSGFVAQIFHSLVADPNIFLLLPNINTSLLCVPSWSPLKWEEGLGLMCPNWSWAAPDELSNPY